MQIQPANYRVWRPNGGRPESENILAADAEDAAARYVEYFMNYEDGMDYDVVVEGADGEARTFNVTVEVTDVEFDVVEVLSADEDDHEQET